MSSLRPIFVLSLLIALTGCSAMPKIIFLNDPLTAEEHLILGISYESQKKWDLAMNEYKSALKTGGEPTVIKGYLGNIFFAKEDYPSAKKAYEVSLKGDPENAPILNNLAMLHVRQKEGLKQENIRKNLIAAEALVKKAITLDADRKPYYLDTLASIYLARKNYGTALFYYQDAADRALQDPVFSTHLQKQISAVRGLIKNPADHQTIVQPMVKRRNVQ